MVHKYPLDLIASLKKKWESPIRNAFERNPVNGVPLPSMPVLADLISICYQVSQMQEEGRTIRFRLIMAEAEDFDTSESSLHQGLFTLTFTEPRLFNEYELLKLVPSIDFNNTLVGVRFKPGEGLQIWGLIHTGSKWVQVIHGGSKRGTPLPNALGVNVVGPGGLTICRGLEILVQLTSGKIISPSTNVFQSQWVAARFAQVQSQLVALHVQNPQHQPKQWASIDPSFVGRLYLEFFKHVISTIRRDRHGGTLLSFPADMENVLAPGNPYISMKYRFTEGGAKVQLRTIVLEIMQTLATVCGKLYGPDYTAGWTDYVALQGRRLAQLDEQVFKYARFMARLTGVDGAVVTTEGPKLVGFGGIIQGNFEMGDHVARALDPEGTERYMERIESVGTRHRSLYHLCTKLHDVLGIVVSQDAKVRVVTWGGDTVLCWDVVPIDFA